MKSRRPHTAAFISLCFAQAATQSFGQTTITKADNATALHLTESYVEENALPSSTTTLLIDDTLTEGRTIAMSEDISFLGIETSTTATSPTNGGLYTHGGGTLTIHGGGITTNPNAPSLSLSNPVALGADQNWSLNGGFALNSTSFSDNGHTLNITGGTLNISPDGNPTLGANVTIGSNISVNNPNAVVTLGGQNTFDYVAIYSGRVVVATIGNYGVASNLGTGGTNYDVFLGLGPTSNGTIEYTGTSASTNRIFNRYAESPTSGIVVSNPDATLTLTANLGSAYVANSGTNGWVFGGAGNLSLNGIISDSAVIGSTGTTITKNDSGTLTLSGANTYTGVTQVNAGTLVIGASGSLANTTTTIGVGGTLAGGGTIGGATTIQGTHTPGFSPGTQTFTNGLSYANTSILNWELTGNSTDGRGTSYDAVDVTGGSFAIATGAEIDLTFGGTVDFLNDFWDLNQEWLVVDLSGSATAADSNVFTIGTISGGANWNPALGSFGIQRKDGSTTADAVYLTWTAVPEPGAALLGGLGMLTLLRRRRCA